MQDMSKVTELTQQLLQAPLNNLALFIAVLALFVLLGSMFIIYRLAPRIVVFLESLTTSYAKMVENLEKLAIVETQNAAISNDVKLALTDTHSEVASLNTNFGVLLKTGSVPVQNIQTKVADAVEKIDEVKDIAIATADLAHASQEAILNALIQAVSEIKAVIQKRKTDSQPIAPITLDNGETDKMKIQETST